MSTVYQERTGDREIRVAPGLAAEAFTASRAAVTRVLEAPKPAWAFGSHFSGGAGGSTEEPLYS
jgi:hypothetical protein